MQSAEAFQPDSITLLLHQDKQCKINDFSILGSARAWRQSSA
jgi:hypothetical protein